MHVPGNHIRMVKPSHRRKPPRTQTRRASKRNLVLSTRYWDIVQRPLQCLVFLLPMVLAYEMGMTLLHREVPAELRPSLASQQLLEWFFSLFGVSGYYLPGVALVVVLLGWHMASRHPWKVEWPPLMGMAGESILLAMPVLFLNRWFPSTPALQASGAPSSVATSTLDDLLLSVGAGIYEELVFRLIIISLLTLLLIDIGGVKQVPGVALAMILSSLMFAAHHYHPIGADEWAAGEFAFRMVAGGYLALVFVVRGFGLAVGCHVVYDVMAFVL
jgi:membrane protease YdiL (CAAX protease family)